jgi:hypothetical protein
MNMLQAYIAVAVTQWWLNNLLQRTALRAVAEPERVCRAWHVTMQVEVLQPGFCRAEV